MKRTIIFIFFVLFLTSACDYKKTSITGSGNVIRETRNPGDFTEIENNSTFNVTVNQSNTPVVIVETDDNVTPYVDIFVNNKRLIIGMKKSVHLKHLTKNDILITVKELTLFRNNGTGNLTISNMPNLRDFNLINNGTGNSNLEFSCNSLSIKNNGTGNLKFSGDCNNLFLYNSATGNVHIKGSLSEKLRVDNNGTGNIYLSGKSVTFNLNNSGTGNIDASNLKVDEVEVFNYGTGNVSVYAENKLIITSNGTGDVRYRGNAMNKEIKNKGTGNIKED